MLNPICSCDIVPVGNYIFKLNNRNTRASETLVLVFLLVMPTGVETTVHYLLHCPNFSNERLTFFNKLQSIGENILSKDDSNISKVLLCCDHLFNDIRNTFILTVSIEYIISTKRFSLLLMLPSTKIDTYLFVYVQFIFSFCQANARSFISFSFLFLILTIAFFRLFCIICTIRFFFL